MLAGIPLNVTINNQRLSLIGLVLFKEIKMPATTFPLTNRLVNNIAATARPNASLGIAFGPILEAFLGRLADCLFSKFGGGGGGSTAPALDPEELWEPEAAAVGADSFEKADIVIRRIANSRSSARAHVRNWGGRKPAVVRGMAATLMRTARDKGEAIDRAIAIDHAIATLDELDDMSREELAAAIAEQDGATAP